MKALRLFTGGCHCGTIAFAFRTARDPSSWDVRACQCTFCRAHGARTTSDPEGSVELEVRDPDRLARYRFGTGTTDFLVCGRCGVYVAAVVDSAAGRFATLNVNALEPGIAVPDAIAVSYDGEAAEARMARRESRWTPVKG